MSIPCEKHRKAPVKGYHACPGCEVEMLRAELKACKLLMRECEEELKHNGGVYCELSAFLEGEMPAQDVIAILGKDYGHE